MQSGMFRVRGGYPESVLLKNKRKKSAFQGGAHLMAFGPGIVRLSRVTIPVWNWTIPSASILRKTQALPCAPIMAPQKLGLIGDVGYQGPRIRTSIAWKVS